MESTRGRVTIIGFALAEEKRATRLVVRDLYFSRDSFSELGRVMSGGICRAGQFEITGVGGSSKSVLAEDQPISGLPLLQGEGGTWFADIPNLPIKIAVGLADFFGADRGLTV